MAIVHYKTIQPEPWRWTVIQRERKDPLFAHDHSVSTRRGPAVTTKLGRGIGCLPGCKLRGKYWIPTYTWLTSA